MTGTPINTSSLRKLGFVDQLSHSTRTFKPGLKWRGASLFWQNNQLVYQGKTLDISTIEELVEFIQSLNIKSRGGKKLQKHDTH